MPPPSFISFISTPPILPSYPAPMTLIVPFNSSPKHELEMVHEVCTLAQTHFIDRIPEQIEQIRTKSGYLGASYSFVSQ
jgi:hypothetical protein